MSGIRKKSTFVYGLALANATLLVLVVVLLARGVESDEPRILAREAHGSGRHTVTVLSDEYNLDRLYLSMQGPRGNQPAICLAERPECDKTIWLTGVETEIVDADSLEPLSGEFFCHANLTLNPDTTTPEAHNASFDRPMHADWRLFTLVPGRMDLHLPEGFGIPLKGDTLVDYFTMALNLNAGPKRRVRLRTAITYADGKSMPIRPLFRRALYVYQQHAQPENTPGEHLTSASRSHQGELCAEVCAADQQGKTLSWFTSQGDLAPLHPGATCCVTNASSDGVVAQFGQQNTIHWMVPPGRHVYRSEVTEQLNLPCDTTVHYVTGHLHPYGKRLWLRDLATGEIIFEITGENYEDRLGVARISEIATPAGVPISKNRRYELVCEYNNTGASDTDAMAILYLYASEEG